MSHRDRVDLLNTGVMPFSLEQPCDLGEHRHVVSHRHPQLLDDATPGYEYNRRAAQRVENFGDPNHDYEFDAAL